MGPRAKAPLRGLTVRSRTLAAMLVLGAIALVIAGGSAFILQRQQVDRTIDASLRREVAEFTQFARDGIDPKTGKPFTAASDLVYAAMARIAPGANDGVVGIVDGKVRWTAPESITLRPEDDPELVAKLIDLSSRDVVVLGGTKTTIADYRYVVIPVSGTPPSGAFVVAVDRGAHHGNFNQIFRTYALVSLCALALIAIVGWFIAGRLLRPIRVLARTAQQISESDLSQRIPVTGRDDLTALTVTVNDMLDRLETSFKGQRQLLDDVGHELRTPLTIVRGHLELMDPGDPADVAATRALAVDEIDRMHGLVNDLMLLATASHPGFVRSEGCDLGLLTDEVGDKLRTLADRSWRIDARADVMVDLDSRRITQALLQLGANAVAHTSAGAVIAIGSEVLPASDTPAVRVWVRDEGTGIEPDDLAVIFERFGRGHARSRDSGAGLGLSIVSAIAKAHGGDLLVDSVLGEGTTLSLVLPAVNLTSFDGADDVHDLSDELNEDTKERDRATDPDS